MRTILRTDANHNPDLKMIKMIRRSLLFASVLAFAAQDLPASYAAEVNVYSARKEALIRPVLDQFTEKTGIEVNLITGKAAQLHQRLVAEGRNSPADLFLTSDAGNLHRASEAGLFQQITSEFLFERIEPAYRDPAQRWFGLSLRARVVVYATDRVSVDDLSTYEDLSAAMWHDRFIVRSSSNVYNQSLIASMIAHNGLEETEKWAARLVENLARSPKGGDTDQIRAVAAGEADLALVNTYYYARLAASEKEEDREIINNTALFYPNQTGRGAHVNISGAGVLAHAVNTNEAIELLEYLVSDAGQRVFAELNHEIPVVSTVSTSSILENWGTFKKDTLSLSVLGENNAEAIRLADRAGWR